MEFSYDKMLIMKYMLFGVFWIAIIVGCVVMSPIFQIIALILALVAGWAAIGIFRKVLSIFNKIFIAERQGVHFYEGSKEKFYLPWTSIDDFSISNTQCILRVKKQFFRVTAELKDFQNFCRLIAEQLSMPPEFRGLDLPRLDRPVGVGGIIDRSDIRTDHLQSLMEERARLLDPTYQKEDLEVLTLDDSDGDEHFGNEKEVEKSGMTEAVGYHYKSRVEGL